MLDALSWLRRRLQKALDNQVGDKEALGDDDGTKAVIRKDSQEDEVAGPDSNGNFATDDNENIKNLKSLSHHDKVAEDVKEEVVKEDDVKPLTNGFEGTEEDEEEKKDPLYKDDQWSPLNTEVNIIFSPLHFL